MPAEQLYNRFADIQALEKEKAKVISIFGEIKQGIKELNNAGIRISGAKGMKELNGATSEYKAIITQLAQSQKRLAQVERELERLRDKQGRQNKALTADQALMNVQAAERNKLLKLQANLENSVAGSREHALASIKLLQYQQDILNTSTEAGKKKYEELASAIEKFKAQASGPVAPTVVTPDNETIIVPGTGSSNAEDLENLKKTGEVVSEIDRKQAEATMSAIEWANAQKQVADTPPVTPENANRVTQYRDELERLTGTIEENFKLQGTYRTELEGVNREIAVLEKTTDQSKKGSKEYQEELGRLLDRQKSIKVGLADITKTLSLQTKEQENSVGSLDNLKARYELLTREIDRLSQAEREASVGQGLIKEADAIQTVIKKVEGSTGRFQRNVGNYTGAVAVLENQLSEVRRELAQMAESGQKGTKAFQDLAKEEQVLAILTSKQAKGFATVTEEVNALKRALDTLSAAGLKDSAVFKDLSEQYAIAKRNVRQLADENKILTSDTPGLTALTAAAKGLAGAYAVGAGIAGVFADGNEKVQKELQKLVAVMTLLNGLQEAHKTLQERGAIATALHGAAQKAFAIVVGNSTGALKAFRIALAATVVGAVILAIPFLIEQYQKLTSATTAAEKAQAAANDAMKDANQEIGQSVGRVEQLYAVTQNTKIALDDRREATEELLKINKENNERTGEHIKFEKDLNGVLIANKGAVDELTKSLFKQAATKAIMSKIEEAYTKLLDAQTASLTSQTTVAGDLIALATGGVRNLVRTQFDKFEESKKNAKDYLKSLQDIFTKGLETGEFSLDGVFDDGGSNEAKKSLEDFGKEFVKIMAEIAKNNAELKRRQLQDEIEYNAAVISDTEAGYNTRLAAAQNYYDANKELLDNSLKYELSASKSAIDEEERQLRSKLGKKDLTLSQKADINKALVALDQKRVSEQKLIEQNYNSQIIKLNATSEKQITEIIKFETAERKKLRDEERAFQDRQAKSTNDFELSNIRQGYAEAELALDKRFARQEISEKEYNKKKLQLQANLQKSLLEQEIAYTEALIAEMKIRFDADEDELRHKIEIAKAEAALETDPQKRADKLKAIGDAENKLSQIILDNTDTIVGAQEKLADLRMNLQKIVTDFIIGKNKETKDDSIKTFEQIAEAAKTFFDIIGSFADIAATKQKNAIQDQIDLLEEQKLKDIEVANATILNAQDRAAAIANIERVAQARREQLERRQRQVDQERARFEKAASIANIILNTAVAVTKFLSKGDVAQAVIAGIMGAAQLAIAIATPIPRFAKGTEDSPEGLAIVGEAGRELGIDKQGNVSMYDRPTITYLRRGTKIIPNKETEKIMSSTSVPQYQTTTTAVSYAADEYGPEIVNELKQIKKKSGIMIFNQSPIETSAYYLQHLKH